MTQALDAIVVGGGPNGLAAAIELARAGRSVRDLRGGRHGRRRDPLRRAHAARVRPRPVRGGPSAGPRLAVLPLARPRAATARVGAARGAARPRAGRRAGAVVLERDRSGRSTARWARRRRLAPPVRAARARVGAARPDAAAAGRPPAAPPARSWPASGCRRCCRRATLARLAFREPEARALFAGMAAHSMLPLGAPLTASFGLVLGLLAHAVGWPLARGGSGRIAAALEAEARSLGVEIVTGHRVDSLAELPPARAVAPRRHAAPGRSRSPGDRLPAGYRRRLEGFRYGPGVFKVDWALDGPIPWRDPADRAGRHRPPRRHRWREVAASEAAVGRGRRRGAAVRAARPADRSPTRRARPRASTSRGPTATSPTARPST